MGNLNPLASGNKTATAGGLSGVIALIIAIGMLWDLPTLWPWWDKAVQTFSMVVGFLGATGVLHKVWKLFQDRKAAREGHVEMAEIGQKDV
jgi:hypothetical protein